MSIAWSENPLTRPLVKTFEAARRPFAWDRGATALLLLGSVLAVAVYLSWPAAHQPFDRGYFVGRGETLGSIDIVEDSGQYFFSAENIVREGEYSTALVPPFTPTAFRTPGYPLFLAVFIALGMRQDAILLFQALLGAFVPVLLYFLGRQVYGEMAGFVAGCVFAVLPIHLFVGQVLRTETLMQTLLLSALVLCVSSIRGYSRGRWLASALLFGLAALVKPFVLYLIPVFVAWSAIEWSGAAGKSDPVSVSKRAAAFALVVALVLSPWIVRNRIEFGRFTFSTVNKYQTLSYWLVPYYSLELGMSRSEAMEKALAGFRGRYGLPSDFTVGQTEEEPYASKAAAYTIDRIVHEIGIGKAVVAHARHSLWFALVSPIRQPLLDAGIYRGGWFPATGLAESLSRGDLAGLSEDFFSNGWFVAVNMIDIVFLALLYGGMLVATLKSYGSEKALRRFTISIWLFFLYLLVANGFEYGGPRHRYPVEPYLILASVCGWYVWFGRRKLSGKA